MALGFTLAVFGGALAVVLGGIGSAIGVGLAGQQEDRNNDNPGQL